MSANFCHFTRLGLLPFRMENDRFFDRCGCYSVSFFLKIKVMVKKIVMVYIIGNT